MTCILFFVRAPEAGKVKTRLAHNLGDQAALRLYRAFVRDELATFARTGLEVVVAGTPQDRLDNLRAWLGPDLHYLPQRGDDLGERMANAFIDAFALGYDRALCIGSDLPDLPADHINQAAMALEHHDAVLAPAEDGGYWCIGLWANSFTPRLFEGVDWSGPHVFAATMSLMIEAGLTARCLPLWRDVDTLEDLQAFMTRHRGHGSKTLEVLYSLPQDEIFPKKGS